MSETVALLRDTLAMLAVSGLRAPETDASLLAAVRCRPRPGAHGAPHAGRANQRRRCHRPDHS